MRRTPAALLACLIAAAAVIVPSPTAVVHADDDGLDITSDTTYTVMPSDGVVRVEADVSLRNTLRSTQSGYVVTSYYFNSFSWPMPAGARNIVATTGSQTLRVRTVDVPEADSYFFIDIYFANRLDSGEAVNVQLSFDLVGLPPRSAGYNRINAAYTGFDAYGSGDAGKMSVRFVFPAGWDAEILGGTPVRSSEQGNIVYTVRDFSDEDYGFALFVSARRDASLDSTTITLDEESGSAGRTVLIRSWPGDDEWTSFVTEQFDTGLGELVSLIGLPWPEEDGFVIREAYTPYLYGYAGWYSAEDNEIEVGEDLDAETVLHEISHAWFNESLFVDRWISEGLAQVYSNAALEALGSDFSIPEDIDIDDEWSIPLAEWGDPNFVDGADGYEPFGYAASFKVVDALVDEIGVDGMQAVFAAADAGQVSYLGGGDAETAKSLNDWRQFLDLLEMAGGSTDAEELFATWVLSDDQLPLLDERDNARDLYEALATRGDEWAPPLIVRRTMSVWEFDSAADRIADANELLDERDDLVAVVTPLGLELPADLEAAFENADTDKDVTAAVEEFAATAAAAEAIHGATDAVGAPWGPLQWIGLIGSDVHDELDEAGADFESGDDAAARSLADEVSDQMAESSSVGLQRLAIMVGLALLASAAAALAIRHHRRRLATLTATAADVSGDAGTVASTTGTTDDSAPTAATTTVPSAASLTDELAAFGAEPHPPAWSAPAPPVAPPSLFAPHSPATPPPPPPSRIEGTNP